MVTPADLEALRAFACSSSGNARNDFAKGGDAFALWLVVRFARGPLATAAAAEILAMYPPALHAKNGKQKATLLHFAVQCAGDEGDLDMIELLLKGNGKAVREKDAFGDTPLHVALSVSGLGAQTTGRRAAAAAEPDTAAVGDTADGSAAAAAAAAPAAAGEKTIVPAAIREKTVALLLRAAPEAAKEASKTGVLPLHQALYSLGEKDGRLAVVTLLLEAYPEAALVKRRLHRTMPKGCVLHMLVSSEADLCSADIVKATVDKVPQACREKDSKGFLPLHAAVCALRGPVRRKIVDSLLSAYPEAAGEKLPTGTFPIHILVTRLWDADEEEDIHTLEALLRAWPEGAETKDMLGCIPLHRLIEAANFGTAALRAVKLLLKHHPASVSTELPSGSLPAMALIQGAKNQQQGTAYDILELFLELFPSAAEKQGPVGSLLHVAAELLTGTLRLRAVGLLLSTNAASAQIISPLGFLPLHLVVGHVPKAGPDETDLACLEKLLRAYPQSARETVPRIKWLPLHFVAYYWRGDVQMRAIDVLLREFMPAIEAKTIDGATPLHLYVGQRAAPVELPILQALLEACPSAIVTLDKKRRAPLSFLRKHRIGGAPFSFLLAADVCECRVTVAILCLLFPFFSSCSFSARVGRQRSSDLVHLSTSAGRAARASSLTCAPFPPLSLLH